MQRTQVRILPANLFLLRLLIADIPEHDLNAVNFTGGISHRRLYHAHGNLSAVTAHMRLDDINRFAVQHAQIVLPIFFRQLARVNVKIGFAVNVFGLLLRVFKETRVCKNNASLRVFARQRLRNRLHQRFVQRFIAAHFLFRANAFRQIVMHRDETDNVFGLVHDRHIRAFNRNQIAALGAIRNFTADRLSAQKRRPKILVLFERHQPRFDNARRAANRFIGAVTVNFFKRRIDIHNRALRVGHEHRVRQLLNDAAKTHQVLFRAFAFGHIAKNAAR